MTPEQLERLLDEVAEIRAVLARNTASLEVHMARTELLEEAVAEQSKRIKPLETHIAMWAGAGKFLTLAVLVAGLVLAVWKAVSP